MILEKGFMGAFVLLLKFFLFEIVSKQKVSPHTCIKILNIYSKNITN